MNQALLVIYCNEQNANLMTQIAISNSFSGNETDNKPLYNQLLDKFLDIRHLISKAKC